MPLLSLTAVLFSCRAGPADPAGFVDSERMTDPSQVPFHRAWKKQDVDWQSYQRLMVADVNTQYVLEQPWWKEVHVADHERQLEEVAVFFRDAVREAFQEDPKERFEVVPTASDHTLVLELALVELVPTRSALHTLSYAAGPAGSLVRSSLLGTVAFEGRVRDAATGEILATFADRERGRSAPVSARNLTWYGHAHDVIRTWSRQFVEVANKGPDDVVRDTWPFTLRPW